LQEMDDNNGIHTHLSFWETHYRFIRIYVADKLLSSWKGVMLYTVNRKEHQNGIRMLCPEY